MSDIHVAPCGCDLHVRIRELEAELAEEKQLTEAAWRGHADIVARAEKAEARVAELTKQRDARTRLLREWLNTPYFDLETTWYDWAHPFSKRVLDVLEAREREAD